MDTETIDNSVENFATKGRREKRQKLEGDVGLKDIFVCLYVLLCFVLR